ncbi:MAG TPA: hypothetical protein VKC60_16485, partial [Opitutaceae bacterium]|nr:hypothetical protein [Opitutaceae bacterium]
LVFVKDGKTVSRVALPVDSIWDIQLLDSKTAYVATGNPGRIYKVDLTKFESAGINEQKMTDEKLLAEKGISKWAEIRDRNIKRLLIVSSDEIIAGSAPRGTLYRFKRDGGSPFILQESRDAEVADLIPSPNGGFYAALVYTTNPEVNRVNRAASKETDSIEAIAPIRRDFTGRSTVLYFPPSGFPETIFSRGSVAIYHLALNGDVLLMAGGEQGELLGYDTKNRISLTFAGSISSQLTSIAPIAGSPGKFLLVKNNAPGFALADFNAKGPRSLETRRIDLTSAAELGGLRFDTMRGVAESAFNIEVKVSNGTDDAEGWSAWSPTILRDGAFYSPDLKGHYAKIRLSLREDAGSAFEIDKASLFTLPQNRRPVLIDFHIFPANVGIIPASEPTPPATISVGQIINPKEGRNDESSDRRKTSLLSSQLVPQTGSQLVFWTVTDPDGDALAYTFSIRKENEQTWTDVALNVRDSYSQFDLSTLADGIYDTKLTVTEQAPRPAAQRLTVTFTTDPLIVDKTPPEILDASVRKDGNNLIVSVHGRDARTLLDGAEFSFNSGYSEHTGHPVDGILDGRDETFEITVPLSKVGEASSVEVTIADQAGNSTAKRLPIK